MKGLLCEGYHVARSPELSECGSAGGCIGSGTRDPGQQPFSFRVGVGEVIRGWDEGCLSMQKHELSRLTICGLKAYGAQGFPAWGIPPNADLQFEIQILAINGM
ncbi:uncharacterized protein LOC144138821 isoform X2 [Haemaphysalis longicornis]